MKEGNLIIKGEINFRFWMGEKTGKESKSWAMRTPLNLRVSSWEDLNWKFINFEIALKVSKRNEALAVVQKCGLVRKLSSLDRPVFYHLCGVIRIVNEVDTNSFTQYKKNYLKFPALTLNSNFLTEKIDFCRNFKI